MCRSTKSGDIINICSSPEDFNTSFIFCRSVSALVAILQLILFDRYNEYVTSPASEECQLPEDTLMQWMQKDDSSLLLACDRCLVTEPGAGQLGAKAAGWGGLLRTMRQHTAPAWPCCCGLCHGLAQSFVSWPRIMCCIMAAAFCVVSGPWCCILCHVPSIVFCAVTSRDLCRVLC